MKQLLQSLRNGATAIADVPAPKAIPEHNLIKTTTTLVSAGTERMLVQFGKNNIYQKARSQPEKVRMVLDKAKADGVVATIDAVRSKLDQPLPLGYCNVGRVMEPCCKEFRKGDRVISNGSHAEIVSVGKNLCSKIPDNVSDESAAFTVLAAIGLQGIRLANPTLGETVVVTGLGLIGLLTVQMLRSQGCKVIGIDFNCKRLELAKSFGAEVINPDETESVLETVDALTNGVGVDAVIITAASQGNEIISQSANMCRKRGRIILVGVVGLDINRADFYEKELTFQVSCSYGPGRYDDHYEVKGHDYPIGYVRWTERRNFDAVLHLMSTGALDVKPLITHRFDILEGEAAMQLLISDPTALGILLKFTQESSPREIARSVTVNEYVTQTNQAKNCNIGFLGAGNYAGRVLIPAFKSSGAGLHTIASSGGVSAVNFGKKYGFRNAVSDSDLLFSENELEAIVIATRHNLHAEQVLKTLQSNKHVFCEKPLCLTIEQLKKIEAQSVKIPSRILMVGFNRRFAPHVQRMKSLLQKAKEPKSIIITVNAGKVPVEHWTQDQNVGGGRMVGECCHFIDLARYLTGSKIIRFQSQSIGLNSGVDIYDDKFTVSLSFEDGSFASINYLANGHSSFPKERVEVFSGGRVLQLNNFRILKGWGWSGFNSMRLWRQDKGQSKCVDEFINAIKGLAPVPIPRDEIFEISRISIEIANQLRAAN